MSMTPSRRTIEAMTLGGMSIDNRTLIVNCRSCKRTRTFLAADLARVYGDDQSPHTLFPHCSKCGRPVQVNFSFPHEGDRICRPSAQTVWKWREHAYSRGSGDAQTSPEAELPAEDEGEGNESDGGKTE